MSRILTPPSPARRCRGNPVHDRLGVGLASQPGVPVLRPVLRAEDGRGRTVAQLHELEQHRPEQVVWLVQQSLVEHEQAVVPVTGYTGPGCSRSGNRRAYTSPALIRSVSSLATSCSAAALSTTETLAFDAYSTAAIALSDRFDDLSLSTSLAGILLAMIRSFLSTTGMASRA